MNRVRTKLEQNHPSCGSNSELVALWRIVHNSRTASYPSSAGVGFGRAIGLVGQRACRRSIALRAPEASIGGVQLRGLAVPRSGNGYLARSKPFFPVTFREPCFFGFPAMMIFLGGLFASSFRSAPSRDLEGLESAQY